MKKDPYGIVGFVALFAVLFLGYLHAQSPVDPKSVFIVDAAPPTFVIQTQNRIFVSTWLEIRGNEAGFAPATLRVVVKNEPIVTAKDNGTWEIAFKETAP